MTVVGCSTTPAAGPVATIGNEDDDPHALNRLCYGYLYGSDGYEKDYAKALVWCKKGAETGSANNETLYAEMYYEGDGVHKDDAIARQWYKKAAEQNHVHAQFMMAILEAKSPKPNDRSFCYWIEKSKAQGYDKAVQYYNELESDWKKDHPDAEPLCTEADANAPEPQ